MCGIVGYIGCEDSVPILLDGLRRLEYRGYDSAGIAVIRESGLVVCRCMGKIAELEKRLAKTPLSGSTGLGHTRWATHGRPSDANAHPHVAGSVVLVHNGIVENYSELKKELMARGRVFSSETDSEVIAHLIDEELEAGKTFEDGVRDALGLLKGSYAVLVLNEKEPDCLIAARKESPLVIGEGDNEFFVASDIPAILNQTNRITFLEDGDIVVLSGKGFKITDQEGKHITRPVKTISWSGVMAEKGGYKHFMLKEIFEQPRAIIDTFRGRLMPSEANVSFEDMNISQERLRKISKIVIVACGTSWHAGLIGKFLIEEYCRIPVEVDLGSEFRYRDPIIDEDVLVIGISQSGETADTLAAMKEAASKGALLLALCNVVESSVVRMSDGIIYTHAGPEIGVASTKAFTTQIVALYMFTIYIARLRNRMSEETASKMIDDLKRLPRLMEQELKDDKIVKKIARKYASARDFLYLGRGISYPVALEGALKLKEISYIHAEGYPAGEMKHGPIALIDESMPVVILAAKGKTYEKVLANIEEVLARGGRVIGVCEEGDTEVAEKVHDVLRIPGTSPALMPVMLTLPLQLLAYHIAVLRGTDVDQPRNLAKSVTVE
ncbi:MAG: glutamine--fructose-6-phosphate aminotransferase [Desulfobacterales bacterium C00003106]|jgi:glucosamine--fructose-6-phosphate aminotransferase (isomerizing)|nr:MAG: glutamine--fructose-6-phosphate aminotransferase [Desulfobacterales bacterium C00003106]